MLKKGFKMRKLKKVKLAKLLSGFLAVIMCSCGLEIQAFAESTEFFDRDDVFRQLELQTGSRFM